MCVSQKQHFTNNMQRKLSHRTKINQSLSSAYHGAPTKLLFVHVLVEYLIRNSIWYRIFGVAQSQHGNTCDPDQGSAPICPLFCSC